MYLSHGTSQRLESMSTADYYPLTESSEEMRLQERHESSSLPLAIKEKDVEYQVQNIHEKTSGGARQAI